MCYAPHDQEQGRIKKKKTNREKKKIRKLAGVKVADK